VRRLRLAGFAVVIVTNQSVIGRGKLTEAGLGKIHAHLADLLAGHDTKIDGFYHCPLKPSIKDPTVIEDPMRKPGPGMFFEAAQAMDLDLAASWMIGDTVSDLLAGRNAGCRGTILVETGYGDRYSHDNAHYDHRTRDISGAVEMILNDTTMNKDQS
jgi:D-glycero-D-manno-heptose 1,7-bisphosphate phosphatase